MSGVEKYQEMTKRLLAIQKEEEELLDEMDAVCETLTPEEKDIVDPGGKQAREEELKRAKSMTQIQEKRAEFERLRRELWALERRERVEKQLPEMKKLEGTYWKFRNSYSSPKEEGDYWWLYRHVLKVTDDGYMEVVDFQIDKEGRLEVKRRSLGSFETPKLEWVPASQDEWRVAVAQGIAIVKVIL